MRMMLIPTKDSTPWIAGTESRSSCLAHQHADESGEVSSIYPLYTLGLTAGAGLKVAPGKFELGALVYFSADAVR